VLVLALCAMWAMLSAALLPQARVHDFLNLYTGATLAHEGNFAGLHDPQAQLAVERRLVPQVATLVPFVRPRFYALLLSPMALLPYKIAFPLWIAVQCALLFACWVWAWRRFGPDALVFAALAISAPLGIASGQDCVVMLAILIVAFELAEREKLVVSGAVLALMLVKFHLILLWPLALVVQKRWRMLGGFAAMAAVEVLISIVPGGAQAVHSYAALLTNKSLDRLSPSPERMISFEGLLANAGIENSWVAGLFILAVISVLLWSLRGAPLWKLFSLTACASLLVVPHVYGYDAALLLLPLWLTIFQSTARAPKIVATLMTTPLPFGFAMADKPWAVLSSLSLTVFFVLLALTTREVEESAAGTNLAPGAITSSPAS